MQHILGREEVSFRSPEQEEALSAVLEKQTPLVVVLPTGGGKSLLYTVPAWLNGKSRDMSIVVLPFRQLIENTLLRLKQVDVECREWRYGDTDPVTVLVVSADHLIDHNFLDYARQMQSKGLLTRVFVDECHLAFTAHHWRPKLAHMKNVRSICVPTVFLTATLPPALHWEFEESLSLRTVRYIHADTTRQRTRYFVHSCRAGTLLESVLASCQRRNRHFKGKEKGIVYCRRKDETEYLASRLGCGYVHAKASDNTASIQTWLSEGGFITATSSLGTGVDFPGVIHIIHAGMPYGMIDFAQESGRAGRAGEEVDSVIIIEDGWVEGQLSRGRMRSTDEMAMLEFVRTQSCRRAVYSKYLDGEATSCDDADRARCDRCGEGEVDIQRSVRVLAEDRDSVVALLDAISGGCVPCWLRQTLSQTKDGLHPTEWLHDDRDCRHAASTRPRKERLRTKMKFERKTHSCWRCSFSQKLCHTGRGGDEACQWPGVAMEVLIVAMENSWGRGIIRRLGYHDEIGAEPDAFSAWLGRRHGPRIWEEVMSNTMAVVLEFLVFCLTLKTSSVH
ncbi:Helicase conserved C-terminal domain-containing protein 1 [Elsinoe fawcettii]|nr:Helicase conserved C-terminal domain-containing protein 1 [Elsinoe fawcettii]